MQLEGGTTFTMCCTSVPFNIQAVFSVCCLGGQWLRSNIRNILHSSVLVAIAEGKHWGHRNDLKSRDVTF